MIRRAKAPPAPSDGPTLAGVYPVVRAACYVAVVHGPLGVRFVSVTRSAREREREVAEYARRQAEWQLAPGTRATVLELLDHGALGEAIGAYFAAVGAEWDHEWLHLEALSA